MDGATSLDDLKQRANDLLEAEKRFLLDEREAYVAAVAVVITPERQYWEEAEFETADEKIAAYADIVQHAKENHATAIITVNSSFEKLVTDNEPLADYRWGDLADSRSQRAITVTISGPSIQACSISLPYAFDNGSVVLGEATDFAPALVDLLPNWP